MNKATKLAASALLGLTVAAAGVSAASAAVVCNAEGECWHTHRDYTYAPEYGVVTHPDNWRWGAADHYRWREHSGRGYWRNGAWIKF